MKNSLEYLDNLDESQRKAVEYIDGPSLVIAGAGSGKTRVLTSKVAFLIDNGVKPWNILALTFTNKAAREMRQRIADVVGDKAQYLRMGTFHSVFSKILRQEIDALDYTRDYTIYDRTDSSNLVKMIVKSMGLDSKTYKPNDVLSRISWAKNRLILEDDYCNDAEIKKTDSAHNMRSIGLVYKQYQTRLKSSNAMDFDDLLVQMYLLLAKNESIRQKYVEKFEFVLVDEYQDTNYIQAKIIHLLTREREKLCVVGDDSQSIYAFRGADIGNILNFTKVYPKAKLFKLERNYRSSKYIVEAANSVISHNSNRIPKSVYSLAGDGDKIYVRGLESDAEEAEFLAKEIEKYHETRNVAYEQIAVLYRKNSQSRILEKKLRQNQIPFRIYGGLSFYERKEIKDLIAYFRLTVNHNDDEAFRRVVNFPARGIGDTTMEKVMGAATLHGTSLWNAVEDGLVAGISARTAAKLENFIGLIRTFSEEAMVRDAYTVGCDIFEKSGMKAEVVSDLTDISRRENVEELIADLYGFSMNREGGDAEDRMLAEYLADVSLNTDADKADDDSPKITLMTIHAAKGLEFEVVFIVGVEEEILPGSMARYNRSELEEERRLFYVALTRAKRNCNISYAHIRFSCGSLADSEPSRFIKEINPSLLDYGRRERRPAFFRTPSRSVSEAGAGGSRIPLRQEREIFPRRPEAAGSPALTSAYTKRGQLLEVGTEVSHLRFGKGIVKRLTSAGDTAKATISFYGSGDKELLLKFAPLDIVGKK